MKKVKIHIIPELKNIKEYNEFAKSNCLKWEFNDFILPEMLENNMKSKKVILKCSDISHRREDTLHGAFFDVLFDSKEKKIRELSEKRARRSMEIAECLGCKGVIFHTNYNPWITNSGYRSRWVDFSSEVYLRLLEDFPNTEIYIENMFDNDPYELERLLNTVKHSRLNCCFDSAHAELSRTPLSEWFDVLEGRIRHMHVNDNNKKEDSHSALGDGECDIDYVLKQAQKLPNLESILLEMNGLDKIRKSYTRISEVFG